MTAEHFHAADARLIATFARTGIEQLAYSRRADLYDLLADFVQLILPAESAAMVVTATAIREAEAKQILLSELLSRPSAQDGDGQTQAH